MRLIDADAMIVEVEDYIEEYSEVDHNGFHNGKWCAMCEAKDLLKQSPTIDTIPVEWLHERHRKACSEADTDMMDAITVLCNEYHFSQKEQEAR